MFISCIYYTKADDHARIDDRARVDNCQRFDKWKRTITHESMIAHGSIIASGSINESEIPFYTDLGKSPWALKRFHWSVKKSDVLIDRTFLSFTKYGQYLLRFLQTKNATVMWFVAFIHSLTIIEHISSVFYPSTRHQKHRLLVLLKHKLVRIKVKLKQLLIFNEGAYSFLILHRKWGFNR